MGKRHRIGAALLASSLLGGAAIAQTAAPITARDVIGDWSLRMTPIEGQGRNVTFKSRDGGPLVQPLTITTQSGGRLGCVVDEVPAQCRIRNGALSVVSASDGMRMIFTLTDRTRQGFAGKVDLRVRFLPLGGPIGTVDMVRR